MKHSYLYIEVILSCFTLFILARESVNRSSIPSKRKFESLFLYKNISNTNRPSVSKIASQPFP